MSCTASFVALIQSTSASKRLLARELISGCSENHCPYGTKLLLLLRFAQKACLSGDDSEWNLDTNLKQCAA